MTYYLSVAGLTDAGRQRELNEDRFYFKVVQASDEGPLGLFVVADGMGGHLAGEVASQWAVQTLKRELAPLFRPQDPSVTRRLDAEVLASMGSGTTVRLEETDMARLLLHAVERANQVLLGYARKHPEEAGDMGSTMTLAVVEDDRMTVAHVGDSRAYLWREGKLRQLTDDHSVPGALVRQGKLTPEEAHILLKKGTEAPFTGPYYRHFEKGVYACKQCGSILFNSSAKFHSECGWPSFDDQVGGAVITQRDRRP